MLLLQQTAQLRAATPTTTRHQLTVKAQQAWLLTCTAHEHKRTLRARGLMDDVCAAVP